MAAVAVKTNPVKWFEIPVSDMARARTFYENVFKLAFTPNETGPWIMPFFPMEEGASGTAGMLMKGKGYGPSHAGTLMYFGVPDFEATLRLTNENDGKTIMEKTAIGEYGFIAHFEDSEGNRVALHLHELTLTFPSREGSRTPFFSRTVAKRRERRKVMATMTKPVPSVKGSERDLVITRMFEVPVELLWRAWSEPAYHRLWWGPKGYACPSSTIDFREGGKYLNAMLSPEGKEIWSTGEYLEIVPKERIVFTDSFADEQGRVVPASHYGMDEDFPLEMCVSVLFEELRAGTKMTLVHRGIPEGEMRKLCSTGWNESFDKLVKILT